MSDTRTQVWVVQTPEGNDAVLVSFVDHDSEDPTGIYLFEPGAEPVEFATVSTETPGNAFEYGTVTAEWAEGFEREWPGEEWVPASRVDTASSDAEEREQELTEKHAAARTALAQLRDAVERGHEDDTEHTGLFRWCLHPACKAANTREGA